MKVREKIRSACIALWLLPGLNVGAWADEAVRSVHWGFLYPNGVDLVGYTVERRIDAGLYGFYTFGFPSLAAAGVSYYRDFAGNGFTSTAGIGIGSVLYGSAGYQWRVSERGFVKLGAGLTFGVAYGGVYPVISYERRFAH